ncbi:hypothetical protein P9A14_11285 [Gordonia hongkongensis]|uniref:Uncharacterized protein n=1 Tax=Gordonia hongkongensis TaxID=1701090 RepID=A0AAX3TCJ2_9ACTN|nr:hypothetical protein [Gordonia hongkongensis]WFP27013.1 hypothetical protein P9A14_11285 [Gordonia hongkongensis]
MGGVRGAGRERPLERTDGLGETCRPDVLDVGRGARRRAAEMHDRDRREGVVEAGAIGHRHAAADHQDQL